MPSKLNFLGDLHFFAQTISDILAMAASAPKNADKAAVPQIFKKFNGDSEKKIVLDRQTS